MRKTDIRYQTYLKILEEELLPAMGCTEPIAVAYAAAMARDLLGSMPVRMEVNVSGNILKNVKSVVVPNTGGLRGIQAAAAAGAAVGQAERELEVIAQVTSEQVGEIRTFLERCPIQVGLAATSQIFYIEVLAFGGDGSSSEAAISGFHTNVIRKRKNGQTLLQREEAAERESPCDEKSLLSIEGALEFADTVELDDVRALVQRQIDYNYAIAQEGLRGNYGANIGSVLLKHDGDDVKVRAKAYAAAGSDARMNGCELPVVIVSGSGNQGSPPPSRWWSMPRSWGPLRRRCCGRWCCPTSSPFIRSPGSAVCPPTAGPSAPAVERGRGSPICTGAAMRRSPTRW